MVRLTKEQKESIKTDLKQGATEKDISEKHNIDIKVIHYYATKQEGKGKKKIVRKELSIGQKERQAAMTIQRTQNNLIKDYESEISKLDAEKNIIESRSAKEILKIKTKALHKIGGCEAKKRGLEEKLKEAQKETQQENDEVS